MKLRRLLTMCMAFLLVGGVLAGCGKAGDVSLVENVATVADENDTVTESDDTTTATSDETTTTEEAQADEPYIISFEAITTDGETLTSDCFADSKLTMLNVWATYCNPCLNEMPDLGEIAAAYDTSEFQMIGIVSDVAEYSGEEDIATAKDLIVETEANYPHLLLSESLYYNLVGGIDAVPTTFFVNQDGELLGYVTGAQAKETWEGLIDDLLAQMQ